MLGAVIHYIVLVTDDRLGGEKLILTVTRIRCDPKDGDLSRKPTLRSALIP